MSAEVLGGRLLADVQEEGLEDVSLTEAERSKCLRISAPPLSLHSRPPFY
jgi:hypothetical protein